MVMEVALLYSYPIDTRQLIEKYCKKHHLNVRFVNDDSIDKIVKIDRDQNNVTITYKNSDDKTLRIGFAQALGSLAYNLTGRKKIDFSYQLCVPTSALTAVIRKYSDIDDIEKLSEIFGVPDYVIIKRLIDLDIAPPWYPTVFPPVD